MNNPKVSIVVPVYNVGQYIVRCLESVQEQTYNNLEIILVDDCGTDDSIRIAKEYMSSHTFPHYMIIAHERNRGLSVARNSGLRTATGKYVYFLDSDDEIYPNTIELLVNKAEERKCDFVIGNYKDTLGENASPLLLGDDFVTGNDILRTYSQGLWYVMAWNKLCRRDFLLSNNLFFVEGLLHEDVIWSFILACKADVMGVVKQSIYLYSIRESSIMTGMSIEKDVRTYIRAFAAVVDFVLSENRENGIAEYAIIEGKKNGIMYSLMQKGEYKLFWRFYPDFSKLCYISPFGAYRRGMISLSYLLRDIHYALPSVLGAVYKMLFYLLYYRLRGKRVEGAVWK